LNWIELTFLLITNKSNSNRFSQIVYVDMGRGSANPVVLSVVTNGNNIGRKWKIKINMIPCNNLDMAPSGCLQYFRSPSAIVQSFNYGPPVSFVWLEFTIISCLFCINCMKIKQFLKYRTQEFLLKFNLLLVLKH
jgi:hypothetical protein